MALGSGCWMASSVRTCSSVEAPVLVVLITGRPSSSKRTSRSCLTEPMLNSRPAASKHRFSASAIPVSSSTESSARAAAVDRDAVHLHPRQHRHQGQLELAVEPVEVLFLESLVELAVEQPGHVGVLGGVVAGRVQGHLVEGPALADGVGEGDHLVVEIDQREIVELVRPPVGVEEIVGEQGVAVDARRARPRGGRGPRDRT